MPSLAELLKDNGVELSAEVGAKLGALVEQSDEVAGLRTAKDQLLQFKTESAPKLAQYESEEEARNLALETALNEKIEAAKKAGEWETVYKAEQEKNEALNKRIAETNEASRKSTHEAALTQVQSMFNDATAGYDIASNRVVTTLADDGSVVQKFKLGEQEFDSIDTLKTAMAENPSYASMMAAPKSGGGNAGGGMGNSGGKQQSTNPKAEEAAAKGDLTGFLQASLQGN